MKSSILQLFLTLINASEMFPSSKKDFLFITTCTLSLSLSLSFQASSVQRRLVRQWSGVESPLALIFQATLARHCQTCPKVSCWPHCWSSKLPKRGLFLILHKYKPSASDCQSTAGFTEKEEDVICEKLWLKICEKLWLKICTHLTQFGLVSSSYKLLFGFPYGFAKLNQSTNSETTMMSWCASGVRVHCSWR